MKRFALSLGGLILALTGCGPIPHTGFQVIVTRPDMTRRQPGKDYNSLYVDVLSDGVEKSTTVPIGANTPAPYKVVVTMDGEKHQKAVITVSLKMDDTVIVSSVETRSVIQDELTNYNADLTNL